MTCEIRGGPRTMEGERDGEGHRTFTAVFLVASDDYFDGPATVFDTPGLPQPGDDWLVGNDADLWAYCRPESRVKVHQEKEGDRPRLWAVTCTFSTKPPERNQQRCQDTPVEDPLLEPAKVSGRFNKYTEEATHDRFGVPLLTSSLEQLRGPQVEFDGNRLTIQIEQNVATALQGYVLPGLMIDCVNTSPIWGLPRRCVKLSAAPWERVFYGRCLVYYKRTLEFDVNVLRDAYGNVIGSGFDRNILDEGTKVLFGEWDLATGEYAVKPIPGVATTPNPNRFNPSHFKQYKDLKGENTHCILNGAGLPAGVTLSVNGPYYVSIQDGNLNQPLSNGDFWVQLGRYANVLSSGVSAAITPLQWDVDTDYEYGDFVTVGDTGSDCYVCLIPNDGAFPFDFPDLWHRFLNPVVTEFGSLIPVSGNNGRWAAGVNFAEGEYVLPNIQTGAGIIHVEKYPEAEFTLLGVPLDF